MSFPSFLLRPPRLTGLAVALLLVALSTGPSGYWSVGRAATGTAQSWQWPVAPDHVVVRPFVAPSTRYSAGHRGIDVAAASGTPVLSPADGVVHFVGVVVDRPLISIEHADGLISSFEPVSSTLTAGAAVSGGEVIGAVAPGHCSSPCLHVGARLHGEYVSPLGYLGGIARSVLLPTRRIR